MRANRQHMQRHTLPQTRAHAGTPMCIYQQNVNLLCQLEIIIQIILL